MTTVMPPEVQACIDGIPPGHRPLFERLHRLILTAHPGAQVRRSLCVHERQAGSVQPHSLRPVAGLRLCGCAVSSPVQWSPPS